MLKFSNRVQSCRPEELRLWSSSWDGRKPVGLKEGGFAVAPLFNDSAVDWGVVEGSKTPKASCHSLLNSSLAPTPGLRRSLRKAISPRSTSSSICSIVPVIKEGPERKIAESHKERKTKTYKEWKQWARKVKKAEIRNVKRLPQPSRSESQEREQGSWKLGLLQWQKWERVSQFTRQWWEAGLEAFEAPGLCGFTSRRRKWELGLQGDVHWLWELWYVTVHQH